MWRIGTAGVSDNDVFLVIILAELGWSTPLTLLEYAVEVGDVIESAAVAYLHNGHRAVSEETRGMA